MVERKASTGVDRVNGFSGRELYLFNEVFVGGLSETFAFFLVKVDVVYPDGGIKSGFGVPGKGGTTTILIYSEVLKLGEFKSDAYFVVLKGNEGDAKTIVSAVEELKRYVEYIGIVTGGKVSVGRYVTYHAGIATFLAYFVGEFIPDIEPVTVLFVNLGAANFKVVVVNEGVAYTGYPCPFGCRYTVTKGGTEVHFSNDISVTG